MSKATDMVVSWTGIIIQLIMFVILAIEGRKIAYKNRKWDNDEHFLKVQRIWDIWGIVFAVLIFVIYFIIGFMAIE